MVRTLQELGRNGEGLDHLGQRENDPDPRRMQTDVEIAGLQYSHVIQVMPTLGSPVLLGGRRVEVGPNIPALLRRKDINTAATGGLRKRTAGETTATGVPKV